MEDHILWGLHSTKERETNMTEKDAQRYDTAENSQQIPLLIYKESKIHRMMLHIQSTNIPGKSFPTS